MNPTARPDSPILRNDIELPPLPTVEPNRQSSKIHDFYGIPRSASGTDGSRTEVNDSDVPSAPRSSATFTTVHKRLSSKLREQYPTIQVYTRRTKRNASWLIQACSPIWFLPPSTLSLLALTLRLLPLSNLTFPALTPLSTTLYLASLILYLPFTTLFLLRMTLHPRETRLATIHERDTSGLELGYLSAWPTGFVLLVSFGGFAISEGSVGTGRGAERLAMAVYVCFWVGAVWCSGVVLFVLACLLSTRSRTSGRTGGARFAPFVGFLVCMQALGTVAFVGGVLAWLRRPGSGLGRDGGGERMGEEGVFSPAMAAPLVVFSFCATGAAWFLANLDYGVLMHELVLIMGWPPPEHTATVFSMVGPLGQCASALLMLAEAAGRVDDGVFFGGGKSGLVTGVAVLPPLRVMCVLLALLMGGMAVVWLLLGIITIFYRLSQGKLVWNRSWYGLVSPVATLAILSILLSMELGSGFFRVAACVIIIVCILMMVINLGFSVSAGITARRNQEVKARETIDMA